MIGPDRAEVRRRAGEILVAVGMIYNAGLLMEPLKTPRTKVISGQVS